MGTVTGKPVQHTAQWGHMLVQAMDHVHCMAPHQGAQGSTQVIGPMKPSLHPIHKQ